MTWLLISLAGIILSFVLCSIFVKGFWGSLWADLKETLKRHWLSIVGFTIQFIAPLAIFAIGYCSIKETNKTSLVIPICVWVIGIPLILIYWSKLRKAIKLKNSQFKAVNEVSQGKHSSMIVVLSLLDALFSFGSIMVVWLVVSWIEQILQSASTGIMLIALCTGTANIFYIIDSAYSSTKRPVENETSEEQ